MFNGYIIKDNILYLNININYEFGGNNKSNNKFIDEIKKYINTIKLKYKYKKIVLTCSGIVIGSIIFNNFNNQISTNNITYVPSFKNNYSYTFYEIKSENNEIHNSEDEKISIETDTNKDSLINNESTTTNNNNNNSNNQNIKQEEINSNDNVTIYRSNGEIININIEDYIIGVVAAEMPASFNIEALKAQSVLARTYALKLKSNNKRLTDTVNTQAYIDINQMKKNWGSNYNDYYNKIKNAVENTKSEYLSYNNDYIEALYHSTNNGKTESSLDVFGNYYPYLISVTSEFDRAASSYLKTISLDLNTVSSKLGINLSNDSIIEIIDYTDGNNIKTINIDGTTFTGKHIRETLNLRSTDFDFNIENNNVIITTRGYGHGVGMSQYGANGMANSGYNYKDILYHYYPGTTLKK